MTNVVTVSLHEKMKIYIGTLHQNYLYPGWTPDEKIEWGVG